MVVNTECRNGVKVIEWVETAIGELAAKLELCEDEDVQAPAEAI